MQLYFIRHGQSANNDLAARTRSEVGRSEDAELTLLGHQQAQCLARFLAAAPPLLSLPGRDRQNVNGFHLTHLYTSLMVRAVATATYIYESTGIKPAAWPDLHEERGIYLRNEQTGLEEGRPGQNRAFFEAHYPHLQLPDDLGQAGWWNRPPEPAEVRIPRARRFLAGLLARHGDSEDRVAVISHGGFYNCVMAVALGVPLPDDLLPDGLRFSLYNCAITRLDFDGKTRLVYANRLDFMPREWIT